MSNFESGGVAVAAAGTPVPVSDSGVTGNFRWIEFQARKPEFPAADNAGPVYIIGLDGTPAGGVQLLPGQSHVFSLPEKTNVNAGEVYIDAENDDDGVTFVGVRP